MAKARYKHPAGEDAEAIASASCSARVGDHAPRATVAVQAVAAANNRSLGGQSRGGPGWNRGVGRSGGFI